MEDALELEGLKSRLKVLNRFLYCYVCEEPLDNHVVLCVNGHWVCTKCRVNQELCPCENVFSNVQENSFLKMIMNFIPRICRNGDCLYSLGHENDHENYCRFRPTSCRICEKKLPVSALQVHVECEHPTKMILPEEDDSFSIVCPDLEEESTSTSLFSANGHFVWVKQSLIPDAGALKVVPILVFNNKPLQDIHLKFSFNSDAEEYKINTKVTVNQREENCILIPTSVLRNYDWKKKGFIFSINIEKFKQFQIFVLTQHNGTLTLEVESPDTIYYVKCKISKTEGYLPDQQRLTFEDRCLEDHLTLSYYDIKQGSVLHLSRIYRGE